jgi:hypothetical protein
MPSRIKEVDVDLNMRHSLLLALIGGSEVISAK